MHMRSKGFRRLAGIATALYLIGSAVVTQAQTASPGFVLTLGNTRINSDARSNPDGSFTLIGTQTGGTSGSGPFWGLDWNITVNQDPFIIGSVTLTNFSAGTANFNLAFSLPVTPAFSPSRFGGSLAGTLFDANGDGTATLGTNSMSTSIYRGTIDGITVLQLFGVNNLFCFGSGPNCSATGSDSSGLPGVTLPGGPVNTSIGTLLSFSLSAGDRITFNTNFTVEPLAPVPLPASLPLLLAGLGMLARKKRPSVERD
jgi:hypothetical protein